MDKDLFSILESTPKNINSLAEPNNTTASNDEKLYFQHYSKPSLANLLSLLHLDKSYHRASEEFLYYNNSQGNQCKIIDLIGGYGSVLFGHNPQFLKSELHNLALNDVTVHAQLSIRHRTGLLAEKINSIIQYEAPHHFAKPYIVHLTNSGTETVEAAIKHALLQWRKRQGEAIVQLKRKKNKIQQSLNFTSTDGLEIKKANLEILIDKIENTEPLFISLDGGIHGKTTSSPVASSNLIYSNIYATTAIKTQFISNNSSPEEIKYLLETNQLIDEDGINFSSIAGFIIEVIQGEGGIIELAEPLVLAIRLETQKHKIPLIVDEIQTGLFRCGKFLASYLYGINPDYILLGKALGGGIAKIGALLVEKSHYVSDFSILHSSTFSDDDWSSQIALKSLEEMSRLRSEIITKAQEFESAVRERINLINIKYPNVIKDFRGKGLLLGIEIDYTLNNSGPVILEAFHQSGYMSYIFASYLLHHYGLRLGVTLSKPNTLRLEPPSCISINSIRQLLNGLEDLCRKLFHGQIFALTEHLWTNTKHPNSHSVISKEVRKKAVQEAHIPKLAFLTHLINEHHLRKFDPVFENMSAKDCQKFIYEYGPHIKMLNYHEQIIESTNGNKVHLTLYGSVLPTSFFETSLRLKDSKALKIVQDLINQVRNTGSQLAGLGQYTSIVTENGTLLDHKKIGITTGNSLTAAYAIEGVRKVLEMRGQSLRDKKVAIIGASGNICNVMAQILADEAKEIYLFHHEDYKESSKLQFAVKNILAHSIITPEKLIVGSSLDHIRDCDVILLGTNSSKTLIYPQHLKQNAIVLDISVPTNIDKSVFKERPDVECFIGGLAKLPMGQSIDLKSFPTPKGETFACMAETITLGLHQKTNNFSYGQISKSQLIEILELAKQAGFSLGSLKRNPSF
jgi:acetylornithine/succinyldiaminopimelate/putrescine aminotransferase/predicted amino acid dehydrogenase